MSLRRKQPFPWQAKDLSIKVNLTAYLNVCPTEDYYMLAETRGGWIGQHRQRLTRQLAVIHRVSGIAFKEFSRLADISHENIAHPIALYVSTDSSSIVYEFVDLDVHEILPLNLPEIAVVMTQITSAVHFLLKQSILFRIHSIRVSYRGVVKIVLDWDFEPLLAEEIQEANGAYIAAYLDEFMEVAGRTLLGWTRSAISFRASLQDGLIPELEHPFLLPNGNKMRLHEQAMFAMRKTMLQQAPQEAL
ncbi:hypothetical protein HIM_12183 [Hirsutella minnesotensis 3608]|uniref:Protein kinase domain-containing protein n=1 Tax=Hirsutella minnesotensis 3608 TaxID=1043627 RepID=A0A0F7ZIB2_9HYPO|nr:hypothetical protein HIM_12183 [Hirsutella minnesotensis 3608]